jgi:DNA-binding transcriptional LysR family regulator
MHQSSSIPVPPLVALEAAVGVARHGSLTAAALALGVTAGALSRKVAAVEVWLGGPLFERHGRGLRPTPDGERFFARLEEAFALVATAAEPWRPRRGTEVVRISVVASFARLWLIPRLAALESGAPGDLRLRVEVAVTDRVADVEAGEADLAVRYGRGAWSGAQSSLLMSERLTPVANPAIARALGLDATVEAILDQPLLYDSDIAGWRAWLSAAGIGRLQPRPRDRRFDGFGEALAAAEAGLGVALARLPFASAAIERAGLERVSALTADSPRAFHLVVRSRESRPATLALARRLAAAARQAGADGAKQPLTNL